MSIAYNIHGEPFEVPAKVAAFRVRRLKPRGAPEVVYGVDGLPLILPVDSGVDELRGQTGDLAGDEPLRLRLDPIDEQGRMVDDVPAAYVQIAPRRLEPAPVTPAIISGDVSTNVVLEAMRMNAAMAQMALQQLPAIMGSAARLLAAADGAGMPARPALALVEGGTAEDPEEAQPPGDSRPRNATAEVLQSVSAVADSLRPYANLAVTLFGGRNGARNAATTAPNGDQPTAPARAPRSTPISAPRPGQSPPTATPAPLDSAALMTHMAAVQALLTGEERAIAQAAVAEMSPAEVEHWIAKLGGISVDDAVAEVRRMIAGPKAGGGS